MIDPTTTLRTVLQHLQEDPLRYKLFGIWWWPIKALLKRAGYGPDQLYMLGSYQDPETAAMVPASDLQGTLRAALEEYQRNACYPHPGGIVENDDGELVEIYDADAAI